MFNHSTSSAAAARRFAASLLTLLLSFTLVGAVFADQDYTVQPGDNLSRIASHNNTTVADLIAANKDQFPCLTTNPACLQAGWGIVIPGPGGSASPATGPGNYVVQSGDSLARIALKFGVGFNALLAANTPTRPCLAASPVCPLQIGWTLTIPGVPGAAPVAAQTPQAAVVEYFAALNARDFARFKASLHPDLLAQGSDPDFDIQNFMDLLGSAQIKFQIINQTVSHSTADTATVDLTVQDVSPLASINGFQDTTTFTLMKYAGQWRVLDEGGDRVELIP